MDKYDVNQQQIDLRTTNSWLLELEQVSTPELVWRLEHSPFEHAQLESGWRGTPHPLFLLVVFYGGATLPLQVEVFAINAISPFILNSKLKDLLTRSTDDVDRCPSTLVIPFC